MRIQNVLVCALVALPLHVAAQATAPDNTGPDSTVHALTAPPIGSHSTAGSSPVVLHSSGDLIIAADGVLRANEDGVQRWYHADREVADVATSPGGAVYGMSRFPFEGPRSVRISRLGDHGQVEWSRVLHAGRVDRTTYPDITAAANGDVLLCATVRERSNFAVFIDRLSPTGEVRWSRRVAFEGECSAMATDAADNIYWAGHAMRDEGDVAVVERLDGVGSLIWSQRYTGIPATHAYPITTRLAVGRDGSVTVGGSFDGTQDLMPGPAEQVFSVDGYTTFVTRLDPQGTARWTWVGATAGSDLSSVLLRGETTLVLDAGRTTVLDTNGQIIDSRIYGTPIADDGSLGGPYLSLTGAAIDARGEVLLVGSLPSTEFCPSDYYMFEGRSYSGPRGGFVARPGW